MQATKSQAGNVPARLDRVLGVDYSQKGPRERWMLFTHNCSVVSQPTAAAPRARLLAMAAAYVFASAHRCSYYVDWLAPKSAPAWADLYTGAVRPPPPGLTPTRAAAGASADPFRVAGVLFQTEEEAAVALRAQLSAVPDEARRRQLAAALDAARAVFQRRVMLRPGAEARMGGLGWGAEPVRGSAAAAWEARGATMCGLATCASLQIYDRALDPNTAEGRANLARMDLIV